MQTTWTLEDLKAELDRAQLGIRSVEVRSTSRSFGTPNLYNLDNVALERVSNARSTKVRRACEALACRAPPCVPGCDTSRPHMINGHGYSVVVFWALGSSAPPLLPSFLSRSLSFSPLLSPIILIFLSLSLPLSRSAQGSLGVTRLVFIGLDDSTFGQESLSSVCASFPGLKDLCVVSTLLSDKGDAEAVASSSAGYNLRSLQLWNYSFYRSSPLLHKVIQSSKRLRVLVAKEYQFSLEQVLSLGTHNPCLKHVRLEDCSEDGFLDNMGERARAQAPPVELSPHLPPPAPAHPV